MTKVWLAQCLCGPINRHCILGSAGMADSQDEADRTILAPLRTKIAQLINDEKLINPWCELCEARHTAWTYEVRPTRFTTMEEALPVLLELEAEQRMTTAFVKSLKAE